MSKLVENGLGQKIDLVKNGLGQTFDLVKNSYWSKIRLGQKFLLVKKTTWSKIHIGQKNKKVKTFPNKRAGLFLACGIKRTRNLWHCIYEPERGLALLLEHMMMGPLLKRAEELIGSAQFDPLLILTLVMDDSVLRSHTCFGEKLLNALQPILTESRGREQLLGEARTFAKESLAADMQWRLGSQHMPCCQYKARKNDLLNHQNPACKEAMCPTLLQIVERSGKRKHCLAAKWMDALHAEMLNLLLEESELPFNYNLTGIRRPIQVKASHAKQYDFLNTDSSFHQVCTVSLNVCLLFVHVL